MCSPLADSANRWENVSGKTTGAIRIGNGSDTNSSQQDWAALNEGNHARQPILLSSHCC
jgi:hypothetical protein